MENTQLAVSSNTAHQISPTRQASDVAGVCKDIVLRTAQNIQGRKYVRVEGWQSIANAYGCVASAKDVERTETGFRAIGQVRRMDTGTVIAEAEGFVGDDEKTWSKRDEYAKRAMAQTRAISRACRSAFAFVVTYMDAGLETTPAEEVPHDGFADAPHPKPAPRLVDADIVEVRAERVVEPVRKKQPVAAPKQGADYETVTFLKRSRKEGQSAKGKWTRWGMLCVRESGSEEWVNTFAGEYGEKIDAASEGDKFNVILRTNERGTDIVDLWAADIPAKAEDNAQAEEELSDISF
jgi:hypothetical protein